MAQQLYRKYSVTKANGEPTDPNAQYFVLRIDTDPAARAALETYAMQQTDPEFRDQLLAWIKSMREADDFADWWEWLNK